MAEANVYIKYLVDHNTLYPIIEISTKNGWRIQAFYDRVEKLRDGYYYDRNNSQIVESIEREFNIKYKEYKNINDYQFDKESFMINYSRLSIVDASYRIDKELKVINIGLLGTIPIKRYKYQIDTTVFNCSKIKKYQIFDATTNFLNINIYDYIEIYYNWVTNEITIETKSIFNENKKVNSVTKFTDQREGVNKAYEIFEFYKQEYPELMMEMLL